VQSAANELEKCLQKPSTIADLTLALDNVAEKLTQLKRKVDILWHEYNWWHYLVVICQGRPRTWAHILKTS